MVIIILEFRCCTSGMLRFSFSTTYCTISTVSSVTRNGQKKSPCFKSLELKRKFIGHLGQQIFRIRELTVEMVQYFPLIRSRLVVYSNRNSILFNNVYHI